MKAETGSAAKSKDIAGKIKTSKIKYVLTVALFLLFTRTFALIRDAAFIARLGTSGEAAEFENAWRMISLVAQFFAGVALGAVMIPELSSFSGKNKTIIYKFVTKYTLASLAAVIVVLSVFSGICVFGMGGDGILFLAIPFYFFSAVIFIMTAYLSYEGDFNVAAFASMLGAGIVAGVTFALPVLTAEIYIFCISLGQAVAAVILIFRARRVGFLPSFGKIGGGVFLKCIFRFLPVTVSGLYFPAAAFFVSRYMFTSGKTDGAVGAGFCIRFIFSLVAIFSFSLSRVLYPYFSENGRGRCTTSLRLALVACAAVVAMTLPVCFAISRFSETVFRSVFVRGNFSGEIAKTLSECIKYSVYAVPSLCICEIMSKLAFSLRASATAAFGSVLAAVSVYFILRAGGARSMGEALSSLAWGAAIFAIFLIGANIFLVFRFKGNRSERGQGEGDENTSRNNG